LLPAGSQDSAANAGAAALREARVWRRRLLLALLMALPVAVLSMLAMHPDLQQKLEGSHGWGHDEKLEGSHGWGHDETAAAAAHSSGAAKPAAISSNTGVPDAGMGAAAVHVPAAGVLTGKAVGGLPILWIVQLVLATGGPCELATSVTVLDCVSYSIHSQAFNIPA
jgi:hypothetical protein